MVDRGMSGHSGSNMWMNGPSFLFCSLYYASGEKGKRRLSIASQSIGIKQNVSSVEACKGPKSQTKIASEGTCGCVCSIITPPSTLSKASIENDHRQDSAFGAQPNSTVAIQAKSQISAGAALFEDLDLLCMHYHFGYKSKE